MRGLCEYCFRPRRLYHSKDCPRHCRNRPGYDADRATRIRLGDTDAGLAFVSQVHWRAGGYSRAYTLPFVAHEMGISLHEAVNLYRAYR